MRVTFRESWGVPGAGSSCPEWCSRMDELGLHRGACWREPRRRVDGAPSSLLLPPPNIHTQYQWYIHPRQGSLAQLRHVQVLPRIRKFPSARWCHPTRQSAIPSSSTTRTAARPHPLLITNHSQAAAIARIEDYLCSSFIPPSFERSMPQHTLDPSLPT